MPGATELFHRYVQERSTSAIPGFSCERLPGLTRYVPAHPGLDGIILFATLSEEEADTAIENQMTFFRSLRRGFEWKIHALDRPADLAARLVQRGLTAGEVEALMLYSVSESTPSRRAFSIDIRPIRQPYEIEALVALQEQVWGDSLPWLGSSLNGALERLALVGAYDRDRLVGTGWIEFPPDSSIADLHGGAVLPAYRGKGIYSALFDARVTVARARGIEMIAVDAAPMSRPILLRKGFQFVCETTPFRFKPEAVDGI